MNFSREEKEKIVLWLKNSIKNSEIIVSQMETLGPSMDPLIKKLRLEILACGIVAQIFENTETETL